MPSWLNTLLTPFSELRDNPGMLHAAAVHLPLALAVIGAPLALIAIAPWSRARTIRIAALISYSIMLAASLVAVNSGEAVHALIPSTLPEYIWDDINRHESLARRIGYVSFVTIICYAFSLVPNKKTAALASVAACLGALTTLAIVIQVGHQGGKLVYEHGLGTPPLYIEVHERADEPASEDTLVTEDVAPMLADARDLSYHSDVQPILQEFCYGCHSAVEKKGGLDLTTLDGLLTGGEKDGSPIVFGDPDGSPLIDYVRGKRLPQMPKDEPELSEERIQILAQWVRISDIDSIRAELLNANSDASVLDAEPMRAKNDMGTVLEELVSITRSNPNPLKNVPLEALSERVVFLARRNKERIDPLDTSGIREKQQEELSAIKDSKLEGLSELIRLTSENDGRIHDEEGNRIWPNDYYLELLHDLRLADLSERRNSPVASSSETLLDRYTLVEEGHVPRMRRDLRKRWIPKAPDIPQIDDLSNPIDAFIVARAKADGVDYVFAPTSDANFLQRAYADLIGAVPPLEAIHSFLREKGLDARSTLIDELLARDEDYAANWVPFWEDALCSSPTQENIIPMGVRGDFRPLIYGAFLENKPFDTWVTQLLDPYDTNNPSTYIIRGSRVELIQSASNVAQVFLGTGMKCAGCHNHFDNAEWTQSRFLEFVGYFNGDDLELIRCEQPTGQMLPAKFPWDIPGIDISTPTGEDKLFARPSKVARLITDPANPRFTHSIINRLWKRYMGLGFYEPADDFREDTYISHPELLDWLANDLILHNYDLKHTIRLILNSQTYQQKYDPTLEDHFSLASPNEKRYFQSPQLRRLWTEQLIDSIHAATNTPWQGDARTFHDDEITAFMAALGRPQSRDEVSTYRLNQMGIVSGLELLNSEEYHALIYDSPRVKSMAQGWKAGRRQMAEIASTLYLSFFGRLPTEEETRATQEYLLEADLDASMPIEVYENAVGDIAWALSTSPEFQYIH